MANATPPDPSPTPGNPDQRRETETSPSRPARSADFLRAVIDATPDAIFIKDLEGKYLLFNAAAARFVGRPAEEVLGHDDRALFNDAGVRLVRERDRRVLESGISETAEEELTSHAGVPRTYLATKLPYRDETGQIVGVLGISRDITELKRGQRLISGHNGVLALIASGAPLRRSLDALLRFVEAQSPGLVCSILIADAQGTRLHHGAAPRLPDTYNRQIDGMTIGPEAGSCGAAAFRKEPVFVADIASDPLWNHFRHLALPLGLRACWSTPILDADQHLLGTFAIYFRQTGLPEAEHRRLIELATATAAIAINRERSMNSVREREEQFRLFVQHAPVAIAMFDTGMRYVATSARWLQDYGLEGRELQGQSHYDVLPEVPASWRAIHQRCLAGAIERHENDRFERADGTHQWIRWEIHPWYTSQGVIGGLMIFSEDITVRYRAERHRATEHAVAKVLAEARSLGEAIPAVLKAIAETEGYGYATLWQIEAPERRLRCTTTWHAPSHHFAELEAESHALVLGSGEGLPGRVWDSGRVIVISDIRAASWFLRRKGAEAAGFRSAVGVPILAGGQVTGVLDFFSRELVETDTEFQETLSLLGSQVGQFIERTRAREEVHRFVALSPAVLYALRVTPQGLKCYWASENLGAMTGYRLGEDTHGNWWSDHLHPEDRERVLAANLPPYASDHQVFEFRFRHRDGHYLWLRDEKRLRRDEHGQVVEIIGAWLDITERMRLELQLRQAQKMEALGLLSGGIAHDFNNILGAIIGQTELVSLDLGPDHPATENLEHIVQASRRATSLIRQILAFARQEPGERQVVDLRGVVRETARLLRATIPSGVELACTLADQPCVAMAGETQIQQALLNLGTNAWQALTGPTGLVEIDLQPVTVTAAEAELHPDLHAGRYLRLRVRDNGQGMDPATLERIFDPFFTTKAADKGTGLGLSVVHGIVRSHHGAIQVASTPGGGTTFDLYLPEFATPSSPPSTMTPPLQRGAGQHILVVDDEIALGKTIARALERFGYKVTLHHQAEGALSAFAAQPEAFDLVISDLNMPGISGLAVARRLLESRPHLPILLTSGFIAEATAQEVATLGIRGILRKPVTLTELNQAVQEALVPPSPPATS